MASGWHRRGVTAASKARSREYATPAYREAGKQAARLVASGHATCWRCRHPIPPTAQRGPDWQLGHDDNNRRIIRGPEHTPCNLRAAARKGAVIANRRGTIHRAQSRAW